MSEATRPEAENGVLVLGPWPESMTKLVAIRWPEARFEQLGPTATRIDLSFTPRGACPGFNDAELLGLISATGAVAIGFFCDGRVGAEGVRIFERGRQGDARRVVWAEAQPPDPVAWPLGSLALQLSIPLERLTRVARPPRPPLAMALEALLNGEDAATAELRHQGLQLLGEVPVDEATAALVRFLDHEDWVSRFHAVRSYCRQPRSHGKDERPRLEVLLRDPDEGVRENALRGVGELIPQVAFSDVELQRQIDAAIAAGLKDEDEDVRAAAAEVGALRRELLG